MEGDNNTGGDATVNSISAESIHSRRTDGLSLNENTYRKPTIRLTEKLWPMFVFLRCYFVLLMYDSVASLQQTPGYNFVVTLSQNLRIFFY